MKFYLKMLSLFAIAVLARPSLAQSQSTHEFKWDNLVLAATKMDEHFDYETNTDWYMEHFRPDVWQNARNDEFRMQEKRIETEGIFRTKVADFDLNRDFLIRSTVTLGDYDFENEMFPVSNMDTGYHWLDRSYKNGSFPRTYSVFPRNIEILNRLPMSKEEARNFINSRKDRHGWVDRRVCVKFTVRLGEMRDRASFDCEIQQGRFYMDKSYTRPIGSEIQKAAALSQSDSDANAQSQDALEESNTSS